MANIKLKIEGISTKEATIDSDWEIHELNSTLHPYLSDDIDSVTIDKIKIVSISDALSIDNNGSIANVGDEILMTDMNSGLVILAFDHSYSSGILEYQAIGSTSFNIKLTINSIV